MNRSCRSGSQIGTERTDEKSVNSLMSGCQMCRGQVSFCVKCKGTIDKFDKDMLLKKFQMPDMDPRYYSIFRDKFASDIDQDIDSKDVDETISLFFDCEEVREAQLPFKHELAMVARNICMEECASHAKNSKWLKEQNVRLEKHRRQITEKFKLVAKESRVDCRVHFAGVKKTDQVSLTYTPTAVHQRSRRSMRELR
uniref:Uncharacterized protein n=1 Tax=Octactis speculum TaxID=3111310 RepID=A0A7S2GJV3_9STRA|mmetsp:Transcript_49805/g.67787  ORF Transcript_49805/g.67787 Transcript_49805/m.67787 type:complete len:197 (+) Transcript_49805:104-694(+)